MKRWLFSFATVLLSVATPAVAAPQPPDTGQSPEAAGQAGAARESLAAQVRDRPRDVAALTNYAEFLDRYGDPACRDAYRSLLSALGAVGDTGRSAVVARRLVRLDLLTGDREAALKDADAFAAAAGHSLSIGDATAGAAGAPATVFIPGPLRSFARMAALSPNAAPADILPALARNVVTIGYEASGRHEGLEPTEYLKLIHRYLSQAGELQALAGEAKVVRVDQCDSAQAADLLRIVGYRIRGGCGSEVVLEAVNATRAFITSDSGFPLNELEQALRTNRPFTFDFHPTEVPVLLGPGYWGVTGKASPDFVDAFISDPSICRLYLGLAKLDPETAKAIQDAVPIARLKAFAHVLDFYGGMFEIRGGKAVAPGGPQSAAAWGELAGSSPDRGGAFFDKLISKDDGWLASYYDALARIRGPVADYLTDPVRMKRFYSAIRGRVTSPGPARPVFRSNADMMLLTTRLRLDSDGRPHIPGGLEVWKRLFAVHPQGKYDDRLSHLAVSWKDPDDLVEGLFALCRKDVDNQPLRIFMAVSDVDRGRAAPLDAATVERMARLYKVYGAQYAVFNESRGLSAKSMNAFFDTAEAITKTKDQLFHNDVAGVFQSLVGLWQILVRQRDLPEDGADAVFAGLAGDFAQIRTNRDLFDAGRRGLNRVVDAARPVGAGGASSVESRLLDLLAGGSERGDPDATDQAAQGIARVLDAQRIVPLDTLLQFADQVEAVSRGAKLDSALIGRLASRIGEVDLPRASLSAPEKNGLNQASWPDKHIDAQRNLNLRTAVARAASDPEKLRDVRGQLAPLLRDTLLAYSYAYYAPPGAQALYANPLFVRSHDFLGSGESDQTWRPAEVLALGWPSNSGGRLTGSLAALPYALADAEQNFLVPSQTQALIWTDLAPQMIVSATLPRWWAVSPAEIHWVGLHLRYARELLAESALDAAVRNQTLDALAGLATPARTSDVGRLLAQGQVKAAVELVAPAELFSMARALASTRKDEDSCVLAELRTMMSRAPAEANYAAVSRAFGTPKPTLANSYQPELLNLRTFPALMGYSSRILAESWESNTLYWAALADELYLPPSQLNARIPEWTRRLVESIFAANLDDWPALLRSLRSVGDEERAHNRPAGEERRASLEGLR